MARKGLEVTIRDKGLTVMLQRIKGGADEVNLHVGVIGDPETAMIAAVHELGSRDGHTPKRSFLRSTADLFREKYAKIARIGYGKFLDGQWTMEQAMAAVGVEATSDIKRAILKGIKPSLAESTLARKKRKGMPRPKTALYATGKLYESIRYILFGKGQGSK